MNMLDRIRFVLIGTSHPGNIGAAARAMKTMGLARLTLVAPEAFPHADATARASGADDVLANADVVGTLSEALAGIPYAVGTSARLRAIPLPHYGPRELAERIAAPDEHPEVSGEVAIVFGRERIGLTNDEIDTCQGLLQIDSEPSFSSLNLGAAVQIVAYELRCAAMAGAAAVPAETSDMEERPDMPALESFFEHLERALYAIRFLTPGQAETMLKRLRRLVHRAAPSRTELNILRGILSRTEQTARLAEAAREPD